MIIAVGTDIIEVSRIERAMENPRFVKRILTSREQEVITTPIRVAGRWAAKEAIAKCLGVMGYTVWWQDVEVLNNSEGVPYASVKCLESLGDGFKLHITISHEKNFAVAFAVLERL